MLEEATRGTTYSTIVKPYARTKNGRQAWLAMLSSHIGNDKWENIQREKMNYLMNTKWLGKTYSLEKFTSSHRAAFVQLQEAAQHVDFQLLTEHTRVQYLLDNITNNDADLRAALASIRINTNGMRDNFERSVSFLLPVDPFSKSKLGKNKTLPSVAALKNSKDSKTGVEFRWYAPGEYVKLSAEQKQELYQWQKSKEGRAQLYKDRQRKDNNSNSPASNQKNTNNGGMTRRQLQAQVDSLQSKLDEQSTVEKMAACIATTVGTDEGEQTASNKKRTISEAIVPTPTTQYMVAAQALNKILKRNKQNTE